jgi:transcriptional regulator with XRE-family HTH domain
MGNTQVPCNVTGTRPAASLLRELRSREGKSLRAVADELGVAPSHLSRLERGEKGASDELASRAAEYYGVDPELLGLAEGRVPADVVAILRNHPEVLTELRGRYSGQRRDAPT